MNKNENNTLDDILSPQKLNFPKKAFNRHHCAES